MSKLTRPSPIRLKQIIERQDPPRFGQDYVPSIKASREEAPPRSRPAWVWWQQVGRSISTLSSVERSILVISLHSGLVWEVHDQRMLPPMPRPHPLTGHPKAAGLSLPPMRGTVDVADNLGLLSFHPLIRVPALTEAKGWELVPFPFVGDLLLFLEDEHGPYNVNLNIKGKAEEFEQAEIDSVLRGDRAKKSQAKTRARHAIEAQLHADVRIPTLQLSRRDYDDHVAANLMQIFGWHNRKDPFSAEQRDEVIGKFNGSLVTGSPAIEVAWALSARYGWQLYDIKIVLHKAIWHRKIRIDLFQPFLFDKPLQPERRDVLSVYGNWFKR
jgi:hypothetical protein